MFFRDKVVYVAATPQTDEIETTSIEKHTTYLDFVCGEHRKRLYSFFLYPHKDGYVKVTDGNEEVFFYPNDTLIVDGVPIVPTLAALTSLYNELTPQYNNTDWSGIIGAL